MKKFIEDRKIDYPLIFRHPEFQTNLNLGSYSETPDLNFFVPVRGRTQFFKPFIRYAKYAESESKLKVNFVIIENDVKPLYKDLCEKERVDYIFIPTSVSYSDGIFAKSLCYNIGFLLSQRSEWNVFHDLDILIDDSYFNKVSKYLESNPSWVQPYTKKRVILLGPMSSSVIINSDSTIVNFSSLPDKKESAVGAPGGSIVVRSSDFIKVGGFDPELFFGYSPEDSFFWTKLEILYGANSNNFKTHFQGKGVHADDPPIEVYHLHHAPAINENKYYKYMLDILHSYWNYSIEDRKDILQTISSHFNGFC
jgi:hypothetical protein